MDTEKQAKATQDKIIQKTPSKPRSPKEVPKANQQARLDLVFTNNAINESFNQHQFVIQDPDQLNQRYNQFKVRFAEKLLPSRELVERQMGKLLQKEFPQLYRFKLLLHITQVSQMLFINETEFTYWFAALRAYFLHLDNTYEAKPTNSNKRQIAATKGQATNDAFITEWQDKHFLDTLILAGMLIKKKLLQSQIIKYETNKQYQNSQLYFSQQGQVNQKIQNSRSIQDQNHQIIVEDSQNEIESIEQNIITFKHTEDYHIKFKYFEQLMIGPHIQFTIDNITLKQINMLFNLLNGKGSEEPRTEQSAKNLEDIGQKVLGVLGKRKIADDLDGDKDVLEPNKKAMKRDPVMASYIEWVSVSDSTRESQKNSNGDNSHNSYQIPNCHEIDYNW